jgi:hypothetical protein
MLGTELVYVGDGIWGVLEPDTRLVWSPASDQMPPYAHDYGRLDLALGGVSHRNVMASDLYGNYQAYSSSGGSISQVGMSGLEGALAVFSIPLKLLEADIMGNYATTGSLAMAMNMSLNPLYRMWLGVSEFSGGVGLDWHNAGQPLSTKERWLSLTFNAGGGAVELGSLFWPILRTGAAGRIPCFSAGTKVSTPDGDKNIEDIKVGDTVYAYDFEAQEAVERVVTETPRHFTYYWIEVQIGGETITATRKHLFWVESEGCWTEAANLEDGMVVRLREAKLAAITAVTLRELDQPESTYNLVVECEHNYFVSGNGVLVHNGYPESPQYPPPTQVGENFQFNFDTSANYRNSRAAGVAQALQEGYIEHLKKHGGYFKNPTSGQLLPKPGC